MPELALARGHDLVRDARLPETLAACIAWRVQTWPDGRIWTVRRNGKHESQTYAQLWERSAKAASALVERGARPGRPVVLLTADVLDFVPALWACFRAGCMAVPLTSIAAMPIRDEREALLRKLTRSLDAPVVVAGPGLEEIAKFVCRETRGRFLTLAEAEKATPIAEAIPAASPVCLIATSGSTGRVKLVALGEQALLNRSFGVYRTADQPSPTTLSTMPPDGISGIGAAFLTSRNSAHLSLDAFAADPLSLLDAIETLGVTNVALTSSLVSRLLAAADGTARSWSLATLEKVGVGAEPIVPEVMRKLRTFLSRHGARDISIGSVFGTTETGPLASGSDTVFAAKAKGAEAPPIGRCMRGVELRIVNNSDEILREGQVGKIEARCPQVLFDKYWDNPTESERCLSRDGWYRTGDLGIIRAGELTVVGRAKEVIIQNGKKHALADIDKHIGAVLGGQPAYGCAVQWPDEATESLAVVVVVAEEAAAGAAEVSTRIRGAVGRRFGLQSRVFTVAELDRLPFTQSGKIRRAELAKSILSGEFGPAIVADPEPPAAARPSRDGLLQTWQEVLGLDGPFDPDADFFALGGDSLGLLNLSVRLRESFGWRLPPDEFLGAPTFSNLERLIAAASPAAPVEAPQETMPWPLPIDLLDRQLNLMGNWRGERPTRSKLVAGLNTRGARAPLFWICQNWKPCEALARELGPDQPIYGLRSALHVSSYTEDDVQLLALRYVHEIADVCPVGPVIVGGTCQGGIIALAVAQHLLRRGRHVPLLILAEWHFAYHHYAGKVLLMYGRDTDAINPFRCYADPETVWSRVFADHIVEEIPSEHLDFYSSTNAPLVAAAICKHLPGAMSEAPRLPARASCQAEIVAHDLPERLAIGETRVVSVDVRNAASFAWSDQPFRLVLQCRWLDEAGALIEGHTRRMPVSSLEAGASKRFQVPLSPPDRIGMLQVEIDVIDEGNAWRGTALLGAFRHSIGVVAAVPPATTERPSRTSPLATGAGYVKSILTRGRNALTARRRTARSAKP